MKYIYPVIVPNMPDVSTLTILDEKFLLNCRLRAATSSNKIIAIGFIKLFKIYTHQIVNKKITTTHKSTPPYSDVQLLASGCKKVTWVEFKFWKFLNSFRNE